GPGLWDKRQLKEIHRGQRFLARPTLTKLFGAAPRSDELQRNQVIRTAHINHRYSLSQIGRAVSLHYSKISCIVKRAK
ncbi:MAG: hypothetical protein ABI728_07570, partial [Betaproteobacteria bacterium]